MLCYIPSRSSAFSLERWRQDRNSPKDARQPPNPPGFPYIQFFLIQHSQTALQSHLCLFQPRHMYVQYPQHLPVALTSYRQWFVHRCQGRILNSMVRTSLSSSPQKQPSKLREAREVPSLATAWAEHQRLGKYAGNHWKGFLKVLGLWYSPLLHVDFSGLAVYAQVREYYQYIAIAKRSQGRHAREVWWIITRLSVFRRGSRNHSTWTLWMANIVSIWILWCTETRWTRPSTAQKALTQAQAQNSHCMDKVYNSNNDCKAKINYQSWRFRSHTHLDQARCWQGLVQRTENPVNTNKDLFTDQHPVTILVRINESQRACNLPSSIVNLPNVCHEVFTNLDGWLGTRISYEGFTNFIL